MNRTPDVPGGAGSAAATAPKRSTTSTNETATRVSEHAGNALSPRLRERLCELWQRTGDDGLLRLSEGRSPFDSFVPETPRDWTDAASSCLMDVFKATEDAKVFELLIELNQETFLHAIRDRLRGYSRVDIHDVLQEALLNICQYRQGFVADKPAAFRNWGQRIAINAACRLFKAECRRVAWTLNDDIAHVVEDRMASTPFRAAANAEAAGLVDFAYLVYLNIYLAEYRKMPRQEQKALLLVEVLGQSYKDVAAELGIRVATLKMRIFRARRKLLQCVERTMRALAPA